MADETPGGDRRSVVALLVAVFCSAAASSAAVTTLGKQVFDLTSRELDLGLLGLAEFAPAAVLVLVTGHVADRFDRRRVAAIGIGVEAAAALLLAAYAASNPTAAGPIFPVVVLLGVGRAFVAPSARSLPADVVAPERLSWLIPRYSATWQGAIIAGPVLAGFLYAVDESLPYVAMAALLVAGAAAILLVRVRPAVAVATGATDEPVVDAALLEAGVAPTEGRTGVAPPSRRAGLHEALEGLRFIRRQPILLGAIGLDLFAVLFGGAVALLPAIATERLGTDSVGLGWLRAAGGIGAALVTLVLARRPLNRRVGRRLLAAVALFGLGTIALGLTHDYVVALVAMAVLSGADAISVFIRATLVPLVTPAHMRGRVLAVENVFIGASNELGAFESGVVGQALGVAPAVVLGGGATLVVALAWSVLFPALRAVDRFPTGPDPDPAEAIAAETA
ncbi:MAG: MFS transporter [Acidimicrobiia bacterium]|nr:MFS transporter [Acidimicrobiia bacterium]